MRKVFHKILSVLMTLVVLFSTMSFIIDMHYCGDVLVDAAIFKKAETCGMEIDADTSDTNHYIQKKNCCSQKQILKEGQDELKTAHITLDFSQQLFIVAFTYSYVNLFEGEQHKVFYKDYKPPLVVKEIYKLDETYLI